MKNDQKGFTLIELLVVIAIIGILAGILFLAIKPKEKIDEGNDATIKNTIDSMRVVMVNYFAENDYSFEGAKNNLKIKEILDSDNLELESSKNKWAVKGELSSGKWFCRDSEGYASEKASQDISDYMCD